MKKLNLKHAIYFFAVTLSVLLVACGAPQSFDNTTNSKFKSPFEKDKVLLSIPTQKTVFQKKIAPKKMKFNIETDGIPSSIILDLECAAAMCNTENAEEHGRLSCSGYSKFLNSDLPKDFKNYSYDYDFDAGETPEKISEKLNQDPIDSKCVVGISNQFDTYLAASATANDPDLEKSEYLESPFLDQIKFYNSQTFIDSTLNNLRNQGQQVRVGIIDGDFFSNNPDIPSSTYITDFSSTSLNYKVEDNIINVGGAPLPTVLGGHGTHVSELIFGSWNNHVQGFGISAGENNNRATKLIAANVYSVDEETGTKYISTSDVNNAIYLMSYMKADVINMSLTGYSTKPPATQLQAILTAIGGGAVVIVAAGNNSYNLTSKVNKDGVALTGLPYPAAWGADYMGLITVAALNKSATDVATFSNFGNLNIEIAAPGTNLVINGQVMSGTSFSAPLVTGAVANMIAYYKSQQIAVTPAQVELGLLAASSILPSLVSRVQAGRVLDLEKIKDFISTKSVQSVPQVVLDTDGFWYTRTGTSMNYTIRSMTSGLMIEDPNVFIGIWEKLDMSLPPLISEVAKNGISVFDQPFYNFVVGDEGFWLVLYRVTSEGKRIPISSKLYKFTELVKTPKIADSQVLGDLNQVDSTVKGWACLEGRPEHLKIEARIGSPDGVVDFNSWTDVQPKGREYFDACSPFHIMLGYSIPINKLKDNTDYYFVAIHPSDPNKNKLLNARPIKIELRESAAPILYDLKKTITETQLIFNAKICWVNQSQPGVFEVYFPTPNPKDNLTIRNWLIESTVKKHPTLSSLYSNGNLSIQGYDYYFNVEEIIKYDKNTLHNYNFKSYLENDYVSPDYFKRLEKRKEFNNYILTRYYGDSINEVEARFKKESEEFKMLFVDVEKKNYFSGRGVFFQNADFHESDYNFYIENNDNCTSLNKIGFGQSIQWSVNIKKLKESYNIETNPVVILSGADFDGATIKRIEEEYKNIFVETLNNMSDLFKQILKNQELYLEYQLVTNSGIIINEKIELSKVPKK